MNDFVKSNYYNIWIAGDLKKAKEICREFCYRYGFCVTVTPTSYIYTGGEEEGVLVRCINYPRFPSADSGLYQKVLKLAENLREGLYQMSYTVEGKDMTVWNSLKHNS